MSILSLVHGIYPSSPAIAPRPELSSKIESYANVISRSGIAIWYCISSPGLYHQEVFRRVIFAALRGPLINRSTVLAIFLATNYALPTVRTNTDPSDGPTHPRGSRICRTTYNCDSSPSAATVCVPACLHFGVGSIRIPLHARIIRAITCTVESLPNM